MLSCVNVPKYLFYFPYKERNVIKNFDGHFFKVNPRLFFVSCSSDLPQRIFFLSFFFDISLRSWIEKLFKGRFRKDLWFMGNMGMIDPKEKFSKLIRQEVIKRNFADRMPILVFLPHNHSINILTRNFLTLHCNNLNTPLCLNKIINI